MPFAVGGRWVTRFCLGRGSAPGGWVGLWRATLPSVWRPFGNTRWLAGLFLTARNRDRRLVFTGAKKEKRKREPPALQAFEEAELVQAAALLDAETAAVREEMGHSATPLSEYMNVWQACNSDIIWLPSAQSYGRAVNATVTDRYAQPSFDSPPVQRSVCGAPCRWDMICARRLLLRPNRRAVGLTNHARVPCGAPLSARGNLSP